MFRKNLVGEMAYDYEGFNETLLRSDKDIYKGKILTEEIYNVINYDYVVELLNEHHSKLDKSNFEKRAASDLRGEKAIVSVNNDKWEELHSELIPFFMNKSLNSFYPDLVRIVDKEISNIEGESININPYFYSTVKRLMGNFLFENVSKAPLDKLTKLEKESYINNITNTKRVISLIFIPRSIPTPSRNRINKLRNYVDKEIFDYMKNHSEGLVGKLDKSPLEDQEKLDLIKTIFIAGLGTTAQLSSNLVYRTFNNKEIKRKLEEELSSYEYPVEMSEIKKIDYLEKLVKETLRHSGIVSQIGRKAIKDIESEEFSFEKGDTILLPLYVINNHKRYWKNPREFDPSRWDERNDEGYIPFGHGPRRCPGRQLAKLMSKVILTRIIQKSNASMQAPNEIDYTIEKGRKIKSDINLRLDSKWSPYKS